MCLRSEADDRFSVGRARSLARRIREADVEERVAQEGRRTRWVSSAVKRLSQPVQLAFLHPPPSPSPD